MNLNYVLIPKEVQPEHADETRRRLAEFPIVEFWTPEHDPVRVIAFPGGYGSARGFLLPQTAPSMAERITENDIIDPNRVEPVMDEFLLFLCIYSLTGG